MICPLSIDGLTAVAWDFDGNAPDSSTRPRPSTCIEASVLL
jgi:hypothetical protein